MSGRDAPARCAFAGRHAARGLVSAALLLLLSGCSLGQGEGRVHSDRLFARDCWFDPDVVEAVESGLEPPPAGDDNIAEYDLQPNFFAAVPYRDTLQIRVQRGNDLHEVSDGLGILIDDIPAVRARLGQELEVALPVGVAPPGSVPVPPGGDPPIVHMALYLQRSCHNQNIVLHAVSGTVIFDAVFSGDPHEASAAEKFTDARFDVMVGDPRDVAVGAPAHEIPPAYLTRLEGFFRFYFERGQPGQPFP